ncbi:DUF4856 domain-containing protein [bacterium]|nr:DUF4856 domain-containing protein [bacterium]
MLKTSHQIAIFCLALTQLVGCKDDPVDTELPTPVKVPETYDFDNVSYSGQTERLTQLEEMSTYLKTANSDGVELDKSVLTAMFENTGENANGNFTFTSSKQLKDKCFEPDQALIDSYFESAVTSSQSTESGSEGVAGRISSAGGSESRLFDENGWEPQQLIEKVLMGAVFYYQATSIYLSTDKMNVDNEIVEEGEGTTMQHHWDEAYGYFGASKDFPDDTENLRFWAKYCNGRDPLLNSNEKLGDALRTGRAAINAERYDTRDEAIVEVRKQWELVCAATAIHYINGGIENIADDYTRNHELSEAFAFVHCLQYNEDKVISSGQMDEVKDLIGNNLYQVTSENLASARDLLAEIYNLNDIKTSL